MSETLGIAIYFGALAPLIWRIARRSGHGRAWDILLGAQVVLVLAIAALNAIFSGDRGVIPISISEILGWCSSVLLASYLISILWLSLKPWPADRHLSSNEP